jgi:hypothetical protein
MAGVEFNNLVYDAIFTSEVSGNDIMLEFVNERIGEAGEDVTAEDDNDDDENVTFTEASNMMRSRWRFVTSKKFRSAYLRALRSKNLSRNRYKWAVQNKIADCFLRSKHVDYV